MIYWTDSYEVATAYPMSHARILWDNRLADATFAADSEAEGFEAINARAADTASWWMPDSAGGGVLTMTFAAETTIDCIGIAAHSLGSDGATISVEVEVGGSWIAYPNAFSGVLTIGDAIVIDGSGAAYVIYEGQTISPPDDEALMILFAPVAATAVRITLSASARIGVVYAGTALVMPQMVYGEATPLNVTLATEYQTNQSQTGQFLGRSIVANSRPVSVTWTHLREAWVRETLLPFILAARRGPFFAALRPQTQPEDVGYVWTGSDIRPERMKLRDFMQVQISGTAHMGANV